MEIAEIVSIVTFAVTLILGFIAKKSTWFSNNLIPVQNISVGVIVAVIEWIITKDFSVAIALSGILAGGTYDILHNLEKMREEKK